MMHAVKALLPVCGMVEMKEVHLGEELDGPGECRSASDEDCTLCLLHQGPHELSPLGTVGLQGMALITDHSPKAAKQWKPLVMTSTS